jgi:Bacterial PH domain
VSSLVNTSRGRAQRDALERVQQELRDVRQQREGLPRENAGLAEEVARLEQEVRGLRRTVEVARTGAERPASSLPGALVPPFHVLPSRRTPYGRLRFALRTMPDTHPVLALMWLALGSRPLHRPLTVLGVYLLVALVLRLFLQGPEDDGAPTWSFDGKGFCSVEAGLFRGRVLYAEVRNVEVRQGWLARRFGFGSVRVTWAPAAETSFGRKAKGGLRVVDIPMLDAPQRLAEWLVARVSATGKQVANVA